MNTENYREINNQLLCEKMLFWQYKCNFRGNVYYGFPSKCGNEDYEHGNEYYKEQNMATKQIATANPKRKLELCKI